MNEPLRINVKQIETKDNQLEQRDIDVTNLSADDLSAGNILTNIPTFENLYVVVKRMFYVLGVIHSLETPTAAYTMKPGIVESIKDSLLNQVRANKFNGDLKNFTLMMLLPDMIPNRPHVRATIDKNASLAFLLEAERHSTGRGVVGHARRSHGLYVTSTPSLYFLPTNPKIDTAFEISMTSRAVNVPTLKQEIDGLIALSKDQSRIHYLNGLRRVVSGGLPSLGKRSR